MRTCFGDISVVLLTVMLFGGTARAEPPQLPQPTGSRAIGTTSFHWVDEARLETLTETPDDYRQVVVQIWYPAAPPSGDIAMTPYAADLASCCSS